MPRKKVAPAVFEPEPDHFPEWYRTLTLTKDRVPKGCLTNAVTILENDDAYGSALAYNELSGLVELAGQELIDEGVTAMRVDVARRFAGCNPSRNEFYDAVGMVAYAHRYHPVRQYLTGLTWDGEPRVQRLLTEVLGLPFTQIHETYLVKWFVGAVARVFQPGCKLDTQLIFVGAQGVGKSTFFSMLGGPFFSDTPLVIGSKDAFLQLRAGWIHEVAELQSYRKREHEDIKAFLSSPSDNFRTPFGRTIRRYQRTCVLVGSSNTAEIIRDPTGSRRYWIIQLHGGINLELVRQWRDQLWAEAVSIYSTGVKWHLDAAEDLERNELARDFEDSDAWDEPVMAWAWAKAPFSTGEVLEHAIGIKVADQKKADEMRVSDILRRHGAVKEKNPHWEKGARIRRWIMPEVSEKPQEIRPENENDQTQPAA